MRTYKIVIYYTVAYLLQPFINNILPYTNIMPNLLLCTTMAFAILLKGRTQQALLIVCSIYGLLYDFTFSQIIGINAITLVLVAFVIMYMVENFFLDSLLTNVICWFAFSLAYAFGTFLLTSFFVRVLALEEVLLENIIVVVLNVIITTVVYFSIRKSIVKYNKDRYI